MALTDEVQNRYSATKLRQLTNPDNPGGPLDTTRLAEAAEDVEADFEVYAGVAFDVTEDRHVSVGVRGVVAKLRIYTDQKKGDGADKQHDRYIQALKDLAKVTGRNRLMPRTTSTLTPSDETPNNTTVRPDFDRDNSDGYRIDTRYDPDDD